MNPAPKKSPAADIQPETSAAAKHPLSARLTLSGVPAEAESLVAARPSPEDANVSAKEQTDVISVQSPSPSAPSRDERNAEYATPTARMKSPVAVSTAPSRKNRSFLSVILHTEHIFLCTNDFTVISFAGIILSPVPEPVFRFYKIYFDHRGKMSLSDAPDEILR